ncbi:unnamed protein product [Xylocopa violacea]|uniref:Sodium channel protein Nach n=1 Tax=Xylocopa violacea TaxID=135666 RepID=A0ABP1NSS4_XYLVO
MPRKVKNKRSNSLYFNSKQSDLTRKKPVRKINIIDVKSINENRKDTPDPPKKEEQVLTLRDVLNNYLESTSVHGLQYFGKMEIKIGILGKILWTCTMVICFVCLSLMLLQFLRRYNENPINSFTKTFNAPIYSAPFPAVTICPTVPVSMRRRLAILENVILPENNEIKLSGISSRYGHHITHPYASKSFSDMDKLKAFLNANKWTITNFLKILIPCEDIFESCWWSGERIDCSKSLKASDSSYGLCCSFNYNLADYIGYHKGQPHEKPLSSPDFGRWSGLKLVINKEMLVNDEVDLHDTLKFMNSNGIVVLIHHSFDFPGLNTDMYTLQTGHELDIAIEPRLIQKPRGYQHRNKENQLVNVCIAEDENTLEYFPVYRFSNCYANCRIRAMINICECLPYIYDHICQLYNIERCELDRLSCIQKNKELIRIVNDIQNENFTCSCMVPCDNVNYNGYSNAITLMETSPSNNESEKTGIVRVFMHSQSFEHRSAVSSACSSAAAS